VRYLAVDLGDKRTGLALGDAITGLVTPLHVLETPIADRAGAALVEAISAAIDAEMGPGDLVFGLPINMDGSEGQRAKLVRTFAARVGEATGRTIHFQDERLTSAEADWSMARSGMTRGDKKKKRDALAAAVILRDFLARGRNTEKTEEDSETRSEEDEG
jgi:putative Holliday junction resolvase